MVSLARFIYYFDFTCVFSVLHLISLSPSKAIGAGDAAEWAISRSLKQIENSSKRRNSSEVQSTTSSNDDKSV